MKKTILILLVSHISCYTVAANAQGVKDKKYYGEHMEEARKFAKECRPIKGQRPDASDECQNAKSAVWLYDHTYRPVQPKK